MTVTDHAAGLATEKTRQLFDALHESCRAARLDPPFIDEFADYVVALACGRGEAWLKVFIGEREAEAQRRCLAIYETLDRFARLNRVDYQDVAFAAEDARFACSCDPRVLVLVTSAGGAIVADLAGGHVEEFSPRPRGHRTPLRWLADLWLGRA